MMKISLTYWKAAIATILIPLVIEVTVPALNGQIPYQEGFNDDGSDKRYIVENPGIESINQPGPAYWAHSFDVFGFEYELSLIHI